MMNRQQNIGEWIILTCFFAIVALIFQQVSTSLTEQGVASGDALFNAALFPQVVAIFITCLGLLLGARLFLLGRDVEPISEPKHDESHADVAPEHPSLLRRYQIQVLGLLVAYLILLEPLGFHLTTSIVISAMAWVLGARPIIWPIIVGVGLTLAISFLFEGLLKVVLPLGAVPLTPPYHLMGL